MHEVTGSIPVVSTIQIGWNQRLFQPIFVFCSQVLTLKIVDTKYPGGIDLTCLRDADYSDYYQLISVYANPYLCTEVRILFPKFAMFDPFTVRILDLLETAYQSALKRKTKNPKR